MPPPRARKSQGRWRARRGKGGRRSCAQLDVRASRRAFGGSALASCARLRAFSPVAWAHAHPCAAALVQPRALTRSLCFPAGRVPERAVCALSGGQDFPGAARRRQTAGHCEERRHFRHLRCLSHPPHASPAPAPPAASARACHLRAALRKECVCVRALPSAPATSRCASRAVIRRGVWKMCWLSAVARHSAQGTGTRRKLMDAGC